jgi:outer membrane protein TolC
LASLSNIYGTVARVPLMALAFCLTGQAAVKMPSRPLAEAVEAAWARSIASVETQGGVDVAAIERSTADAWWADSPFVEVAYLDGDWGNSPRFNETEVGLAMPLVMPRQRVAKRDLAQAHIGSADADFRLARLRLAGEVRESAWETVARATERASAAELSRLMCVLADDSERRTRVGELAEVDALVARAECLAARAAETEAEQRLEVAESRWKLLTGLPPPADPTEKAVPENLITGIDGHPELTRAKRALEAARLQLAVTRADRRDPPEVLLRFREEANEPEFGASRSLGVALRFPLGSRSRNSRRDAVALNELDVAQHTAQRMRESIAAAVDRAQAALDAVKQMLETEKRRAELLRERAQLIQRSYDAGEASLVALLAAHGAAAEAAARLGQRQSSLGLARARLHQALGILP